MFTRLLVPLDGSPLAEQALPYAGSLAQASGASLLLVRAALARTFPGVDPTTAQVEAIEQAEQYLASQAARLAAAGTAAETAVPYGEAVQAILEEIDLRQADLVVMATHGRSGLGRWLYGSVAEGVLARSPVPVLLVRSWQRDQPAAALAGAKALVVPLNGSKFAEAALPVAAALARQLHCKIVLLQVVSIPPQLSAPDELAMPELFDLKTLKDEAADYLQRVAGAAYLEHQPVETMVRVGPAPEGIVEAARASQAGLVVMATHGRAGLGRLLLGSVADAVLRHGELPLLLVRPPALPPGVAPLRPLDEEVLAGGPPVSVLLTPDELVLSRTALQTLAQTVGQQEHLASRIQRLLERLASAEATVAGSRDAAQPDR